MSDAVIHFYALAAVAMAIIGWVIVVAMYGPDRDISRQEHIDHLTRCASLDADRAHLRRCFMKEV